MASSLELRQKALDRLLPYQRSDFEGIFRAMDGMRNFYHNNIYVLMNLDALVFN
jgi:hypothetical protein